MRAITLRPTKKKTPWGVKLSRVRGRQSRWGTAPLERERNLPAGKYYDLTNVEGYGHMKRRGHRTLAVRLSSGAPSSKHIYYVKIKKRKKK